MKGKQRKFSNFLKKNASTKLVKFKEKFGN